MNIFYRASPFLSTHPNPLGNDKYQILKTCWQSFIKSANEHKITILNDSLYPNWLDIFKGYEVIDVSGLGNVGTFHKQLDLVANLANEDKVMLVEDDYLWVEGAVDILEGSLDKLELVSPYDHPGHYTEERFNTPKLMKLINNHTYREAPSNTLTFACRAYVIKQNLDLIKSFGVRDHEMFEALPIKMFVSCPALATHLVEKLMSPNIDWSLG